MLTLDAPLKITPKKVKKRKVLAQVTITVIHG